jgi:hypothetical protein
MTSLIGDCYYHGRFYFTSPTAVQELLGRLYRCFPANYNRDLHSKVSGKLAAHTLFNSLSSAINDPGDVWKPLVFRGIRSKTWQLSKDKYAEYPDYSVK